MPTQTLLSTPSTVAAAASTGMTGGTSTLVADARAGTLAVSWALSQIGTPYVWGGETPGVGFDCSGLVQAAYAVAGQHPMATMFRTTSRSIWVTARTSR